MKKTAVIMAAFLLASSGTGWAGQIEGFARFNGEIPEMPVLDMSTDPSCSAMQAGPVANPAVQVNEDGTVRNVFVYIKEGLEGKTFPVPDEAVTLQQKGCMYEPRVFGIRAGQPLEIQNNDPTLHNVRALPEQQRGFNLGMPVQGMRVKKKFDKPEVMVKFKCDVHPWMRAYAGVVDNPFYAVTADDGRYVIKDVPPGKYTVEAWHEVFGWQSQKVTVDGEDEAASADFVYVK